MREQRELDKGRSKQGKLQAVCVCNWVLEVFGWTVEMLLVETTTRDSHAMMRMASRADTCSLSVCLAISSVVSQWGLVGGRVGGSSRSRAAKSEAKASKVEVEMRKDGEKEEESAADGGGEGGRGRRRRRRDEVEEQSRRRREEEEEEERRGRKRKIGERREG
ncbi:hypothetical protein MGYG_03694 [Nannizzia gypsea CBS 118893]|uniref:Uncharacterized protein n=1 Tax=Arthroderma gypseum (strain ATCC MYA-4604 / CBS 118893) TaxID=535722 RepID=E4UTC8_ARTGP|nr:hypothetical protein MGYG_03694 [Nannizzia gypsea CBS 118893]EFR00689.1 hypothetical protein MGYG_03694 [Nannizzia gypsea CBS 118893]